MLVQNPKIHVSKLIDLDRLDKLQANLTNLLFADTTLHAII